MLAASWTSSLHGSCAKDEVKLSLPIRVCETQLLLAVMCFAFNPQLLCT